MATSPRIDFNMRQEFVDLTMVGDRQSRQPSRKQLIRKRRDSFRQRARLHALAFSSRRWAFAWRDQTGVHLAIASSVMHSSPVTIASMERSDAVPWSGVAGADRHRDARRGPA
jgi:hypothetical protein